MLSISASPREVCQSPGQIDGRGEYAALPTTQGGDHGAKTRYAVHRWLEGEFSIIQDDRPMFERWDMLLIGALGATAVFLPLDVSLLHCTSPFVNAIIAMTDCIFISDILLQFNLAYDLKTPNLNNENHEGRPFMIAKRYMAIPCSEGGTAGWFWPDMVTVMPWDSLLPTIGIHLASARLIRLLRLLRILRLVRIVKLFKKWHTRVGMSMALLKIMTCAIATLLLVHWLACLWAHLGKHPEYYGQSARDSWLQHYIGPDILVDDMPIYEQYSSALYFCTVVLTTVGFGDIVPVNHVEVIIMIFTVFLTGVTWAWVVGNIVNIITNLDSFGNLFNTAMDDLNSLMNANGVDVHTRIRIRKHLHESYTVQKQRHAREAFVWLTEGLKGELAIQSGVDKICNCIWYFRGLPQNVIIELADEFQATLFSPNETVVCKDSASVIMRGSCLKNGRLLTRNCCYGEDMILYSMHLRDISCPLTLSFMEVMTIKREDMMEACDKYPEFNFRLRRAQIRLAVWRGFIAVAAEVRAHHKMAPAKNRGSQWDRQFFNINKISGSTSDGHDMPKQSQQGWKECWLQDSDIDSQQKKHPTDSGHTESEKSMDQMMQAVQSLHDSVVQSNSDTQSRLQAFEGRFSALEQEVAKVNEKFEALGQELPRAVAPPTTPQMAPDREPGTSGSRSMFGSIVGARAKSPK